MGKMIKILFLLIVAIGLVGCRSSIYYDWTVDSYKEKPECDMSYFGDLGPQAQPVSPVEGN